MQKGKKKRLSLAEKIRTARRKAGLSQVDFGRALILTDKAVSSYEVGRSEPSLFTLKRIALVTKHPVTYFLQDDPAEDVELEFRLQRIEDDLKTVKKIVQRKFNTTTPTDPSIDHP